MSIKEIITTNGYYILTDIFTLEECSQCKNEILEYTKNNKTINNGGGITIPDFIKEPSLKLTTELKNHPKIKEALTELFDGPDYRFCAHNDIGINRIVGWHKDKLNGVYAKYQTTPIWSNYQGQKHEIVKVLIYLEDHTNNSDGLKLVPKSHLTSSIDTKGAIQLRPKLGDVIIFDQRITHRGMEKQVSSPRILVSFGFGKNNIFTDQFERGTIVRQNDQNRQLK